MKWITGLGMLLAVAAWCGCGGSQAKPPVLADGWDSAMKSFWYEETMQVRVTRLSEAKATKPVFRVEFINVRHWIPNGAWFDSARPTVSDEVIVSHELKLNEEWQTKVPLANGEFDATVRMLSSQGFYLNASYWRPDAEKMPALAWKEELTPPIGSRIPLLTVTREHAVDAKEHHPNRK